MAKRGRPPTGENKQNKITIVFSEKESILFERLNNLASDSDKAVTEIIRNILKIGVECYDLGYNVGFDGKLIKSEVILEQNNKSTGSKKSTKDDQCDIKIKNKDSIFMS